MAFLNNQVIYVIFIIISFFLMRFLILFVHFTALHFAIREKKIGIIQLLLTHPSIDINLEDSVY